MGVALLFVSQEETYGKNHILVLPYQSFYGKQRHRLVKSYHCGQR